jgi:hypothetical protein
MAQQSTIVRAGFVAVIAAAVGVVSYIAFEAADRGKDVRPPATTPVPMRPEPDKSPLPQGATTLAALWDIAWGAARQWRGDAQLTRLYASAIHPDGTFNRATADVQFVFLSKELSAAGATQGGANGFRWALSQAKISSMELKQYPAPSLGGVEPRLCDLGKMAGDGPPAEVVLDAYYVEHDGKEPVLSLFTEDRKFMVIAAPITCEVQGRATRQTEQEADGGPARLEADAGRAFETAKASHAVELVLVAASSCKQPGGPSGPGTVSVRFNEQGKVDEVSFQMGSYAGTPVGRCLEDRIRKIVVSPWKTGRGFIIKRFSL